LRVSLPVDFAVQFLRPVLTAFAKRYPGIRFDLDLTPNLADLLGDPVDIAIRMTPPKVRVFLEFLTQNLVPEP